MISTDTPAALENARDDSATEAQPTVDRWVESALTALFAASAILFVSFIAVVTGLV